MRVSRTARGTLLGVVAAMTGCAETAPERAAVEYVTGVAGAEDLMALPGTKWIVSGGLAQPDAPGSLFLIDREGRTARRVGEIASAPDKAAFPDCPGPYDAEAFSAHGINSRSNGEGTGMLYVVNHGGREAIEVFRVEYGGEAPSFAWIGCVPVPEGNLANGVAPLPDGRIAVTMMAVPEHFGGVALTTRNAQLWMAKLRTGETSGHAAVWRVGDGWRKVPGSDGSGPNGIEASADGRWLWIAMWGNRQVIRLPADGPGEKTVIELDMQPDNLRRGEDGAVWLAGAADDPEAYFACLAKPGCRSNYALAGIDSRTLKVREVPHPETRPQFGEATTALQVGDSLWIGANPTDRLAVLKLEP